MFDTWGRLRVQALLILCSIIIVGSQPPAVWRVLTVVQAPFTFYNPNLVGNARFDGYTKDILDLLIKQLNGSYSYELILSDSVGVPPSQTNNASGPWTGMIGDLMAGKGDMILAGFTQTSARAAVMDFSMPFLDVGLSILVVSQNTQSQIWAFLMPFSPSLWFALFGFSLLFSILTWIGDKITPYGKTHERKKSGKYGGDKTEAYTYSEALFSSLLIFIGKDPTETTSWGLRFILISFMFFSVISTANYTASLASFFTNQANTAVPVKSLEDLRVTPFGVISGTSASDFFWRKKNVIFKRYLRTFPTWDEVLGALEDGSIDAIVRDSPLLEYEANGPPCDKTLVGDLFDNSNYAIAFQKNTSLTNPLFVQMINKALLILRESGALEEQYNIRWNASYCQSQNPKSDEDTRVLDVGEFVGVFALVSIISGLGILVLILETLYYHWYISLKDPNIVLRSIDAFFGGKNKDQSRELKSQQQEELVKEY